MARADSRLRDRVVFLVGARRSGTNWLERILTAHPDIIAMPTETYLFSHGIQPLSERFQYANPNSSEMGRTFLPRDVFLDVARELVDRAMVEQLALQHPEPRYVVERTPWHASHLPLIAEVYPDARVINIVRDGRDVARSLLAMPWGPTDIEEAANEWRTAVVDARAGSMALGERFRNVIYEELAQDPRRLAGELFAWLGLGADARIWETILLEAASAFNVNPASGGIGSGKWRTELPVADVAMFEHIAGDQLAACGYERAGTMASQARGVGRRMVPAGGWRDLQRHLHDAVQGARAASSRRARYVDQTAHNQAVASFEHFVAMGDRGAARAVLAPQVRTRIEVGVGAGIRTGRGDPGADELLGTLAEHPASDVQVLSGHVRSSPYAVTTTSVYRLADGSRWIRVLIYIAARGRLNSVALHRHELRTASRP